MAEKKSMYIETTIPSYATGRASSDIVIAGRQILTKLFWEQERQKFDLYISPYVVEECMDGDPEAARKRLDFIKGITLLPRSDKIEELALVYQQILEIPDRSKIDSYHLSICVNEGIHYLLSWNFAHLGVISQTKIRDYNEKHGLPTPILITPEYLIAYTKDVNDDLLP